MPTCKMKECWSIGVMECWKRTRTGVLKYWSGRKENERENWRDGALER
jgi:hypothetical protein